MIERGTKNAEVRGSSPPPHTDFLILLRIDSSDSTRGNFINELPQSLVPVRNSLLSFDYYKVSPYTVQYVHA